MAELDFPLGKTPTVRLHTDGIEVLFTMTGDADVLWCDLFTMVERPSDPDVNEAILNFYVVADVVFITLKPDVPEGVAVRAFDWLREAAEATNLRRRRLQQESGRLQGVAARWAGQQVV